MPVILNNFSNRFVKEQEIIQLGTYSTWRSMAIIINFENNLIKVSNGESKGGKTTQEFIYRIVNCWKRDG